MSNAFRLRHNVRLLLEMIRFSHTLFGLYLGVFMWAALWLRDSRFRGYLGAPGEVQTS